MDSDESLKRFVSLFPDLPTRKRKESQTLGTLTDSEEGVFHDMRKTNFAMRLSASGGNIVSKKVVTGFFYGSHKE